MMTQTIVEKVVRFWVHCETTCQMVKVPKPMKASYNHATGKVSCELNLLLPPWHANFVLTEFKDLSELS